MDYKIVAAEPQDAPEIAKGIITALHIGEPDAALSLDSKDTEIWLRIFTELAARPDTQYSYSNTFKAIDTDGNILGIIIGYDGASLHRLREPFFATVYEITGEDFSGIPDETDADEWYLDSLAVWKEYRNRGIGEALLRAATKHAIQNGKPAGLLVDKGNPLARRLYEKAGFRYVGDRQFADIMMDHLVHPL